MVRWRSTFQDTIPNGLKKDHNTKVGVWGVINVINGKLIYRLSKPEPKTIELLAGLPGYIPPTMLHSVEAIGDVTFFVEFFTKR